MIFLMYIRTFSKKMIYLVLSDNKAYNQELVMEAHFLTRVLHPYSQRLRFSCATSAEKSKLYTTLSEGAPLSDLRLGETLYVVGHGDRETGLLSGLTPRELLESMVSSGLYTTQKHLKICLVGCHTGHKPDVFRLSFAEGLYQLLLADLPELELYHRSKEGSLPFIRAPKHILGYRTTDGLPIGIKKEDYALYASKKSEGSETFESWRTEHTEVLEEEDFQTLRTGII